MTKEERSAYNKAYREAHKEERAKYIAEWKKNNPEKVLEHSRRSNATCGKAWEQAHKAERAEYKKQWRLKRLAQAV